MGWEVKKAANTTLTASRNGLFTTLTVLMENMYQGRDADVWGKDQEASWRENLTYQKSLEEKFGPETKAESPEGHGFSDSSTIFVIQIPLLTQISLGAHVGVGQGGGHGE